MIIRAVTPKLFFSGTTLNYSDERLEKELRFRDIKLVVNMWHKPDPRIRELCRATHIPIPDGELTSFTEKAILGAANLVYKEIQKGKAVLVHCYGGRNRSGLVAGLVYHRLANVSGAQAARFIQFQRSSALANPHYLEFLQNQGATQ